MSNLSEFERPVIYQLFVRTFGNATASRKVGGTIEENGCGKFADISDQALSEMKKMGFNSVWLTGVLEQASGTSYPDRPADPEELLKGRAGSPYAIKDYFDVCPDYAQNPENRLQEFDDLLTRCRTHGLRTIIDFVPNHVARTYESDVMPELSFGKKDQRDLFFGRDQHFYYLNASHPGGGAPIKLPYSSKASRYDGEAQFGRVTGNNAVTWGPSPQDWYETVKLNYGHDFTTEKNHQNFPQSDAILSEVPLTWQTMDSIIAYWQARGVDGFRADMAHMIPVEFWAWMIRRARLRNSEAFFMAEAYDSDPMKLCEGNVMDALLNAGFNGVYEHPTYKILQGIYESGNWANDLDREIFTGERFHRSIRYLENHDEVRIAHPQHWGGLGCEVGKAAAGVMFGMSRSAMMIYSGQEVGEPANGAEGYSQDDGRTSIFDYTAMPEFQKWFNQGKCDGAGLSEKQRSLRRWYAELFAILQEPAFSLGSFFGLNYANQSNSSFGRIEGEMCSGHWLYAFLRRDADSNQAFFCIVNFHAQRAFSNVSVILSEEAAKFLNLEKNMKVRFIARFGADEEAEFSKIEESIFVGEVEPLAVKYYEVVIP